MKLRNFVQYVVPYVPALTSAITCIAIIFGLHLYLPADVLAQDKLSTVLLVISFISILLMVVILMFILTKTNQLKNNGSFLNRELSSLTQKVHHFRNIVDLLVRSKLYLPRNEQCT